MSFDLKEYEDQVTDDLITCIDSMGCQPILFIGSGISRRYLGTPGWEDLLSKMAEKCPCIDKEFAYYKQSHKSLPKVGSVFAEKYKEWAWGEGRSQFPDEFFDASQPAEIYLKYQVSIYLRELLDQKVSEFNQINSNEEVIAFKSLQPHAIITTNYDRLLEFLFKDYSPVIGQKILSANYSSIGEILKIHGCESDPSSLILTDQDYDDFTRKKKYLGAKLLTYFAEHPLVFMGYSAEDPNIRSILSDIDEVLSPENKLIPNIFILEWSRDILTESPPRERIIPVSEERGIRVRSIHANSFQWVYEALANGNPLQSVNPKLLRALLSRTYNLVRRDIPSRSVEVNYDTLERIANEQGHLATIYGIATLDDPAAVNANFPFTMSQLSEALGYSGDPQSIWHHAHKLIQRVKQEKGIDLKATDNKYHIAIKSGSKGQTHKYSHALLLVLTKVKSGDIYELEDISV
ncbi:MAG: SIR2 family protein [Cyanobacteriota bacterium]|jgi:hypothetical protein